MITYLRGVCVFKIHNNVCNIHLIITWREILDSCLSHLLSEGARKQLQIYKNKFYSRVLIKKPWPWPLSAAIPSNADIRHWQVNGRVTKNWPISRLNIQAWGKYLQRLKHAHVACAKGGERGWGRMDQGFILWSVRLCSTLHLDLHLLINPSA